LCPAHRLVLLCPCFFIVGMLELYSAKIWALMVEKQISQTVHFLFTQSSALSDLQS
jgi:hypothetical protein